MAWQIKLSESAYKELGKIGHTDAKRMQRFLKRLLSNDNPRALGKPLKGGYNGLWRYRVGTIRLICAIEDEVLVILVLRVAQRKDVYTKPLPYRPQTN